VLGEEHHDTLGSMIKLASMYWTHGRGEEASSLLLQVAEKKKDVGGGNLGSTARIRYLASSREG
jgi:hypothetical protein